MPDKLERELERVLGRKMKPGEGITYEGGFRLKCEKCRHASMGLVSKEACIKEGCIPKPKPKKYRWRVNGSWIECPRCGEIYWTGAAFDPGKWRLCPHCLTTMEQEGYNGEKD